MREYPTLQLETNLTKGTACCQKSYGFKWTWENIQLYNILDTNLTKGTACCQKSYGCNEHERISNFTIRHKFDKLCSCR